MAKRTTNIVAWVVPAFLVGMVLLNHHVFAYIGGQVNFPITLIMLFFLLSPIGLGIVGLSAVLLILTYRKRTWSHKARVACAVPSVLVIGILVGFLFTIFEPEVVTFLRGFERWADRNVNTGAIQEWLVAAPESYWGDPCEPDGRFYTSRDELPKGLPQCFTEFEQQYIAFERSELDGSRTIRFTWGGGMFHWSLVVGDPNMKMPELTEEWYDDYDVEFRRILGPGVYVCSRG